MTKTKMSNFPTQSGSSAEEGSTVAVSLRGGRRAGFSVKFRRRIALVIIASILLWGRLFCLLWLL